MLFRSWEEARGEAREEALGEAWVEEGESVEEGYGSSTDQSCVTERGV